MVFQALGDICLIKKEDKQLAQEILKKLPRFKSVYFSSKITGKLRKPNVIWLAGEKNTRTKIKENHCEFVIDISKVMFSKGNQEEKRQIVSQIKEKEDVLDMFAGIGYFTIPIAKLTPAKVWAIELNPDSVELLNQNITLNKIKDKVTVIEGDCKLKALELRRKFNRIHMGYFDVNNKKGTYDFLPTALKVCKKGGIIHFHELAEASKDIEKRVKEIAEKQGYKIKILNSRKVKKYSIKNYHWVIDLQI